MRGKIKTLSWLSLILVIMIAMMANLGTSTPTTNTTVYIDPSEFSGILPDDPDPYFEVNIMISGAVDLWDIGFTVEYTPFVKTIVAIEATEGDFLEDGFQTWFIKTIDTVKGEVKIGYSRLPKSNQFPFPRLDPVGQDGSGLLATIKFKVVTAGESPINLVDVGLHDRNGDEIGYQTRDGYFYGPTVSLIGGHVERRDMMVGETQYFYHKVKNTGTVPLEVRAHWDMYRQEDGTRMQLFNGQAYAGGLSGGETYLYVNEYNPGYMEWEAHGDSPYLDAPGDGNYINGTDANAWACWFGFEDLELEGRVIGNVILEGYTNGLYNEEIDYDMYTQNFDWIGSLYGNNLPSWVKPRWVGGGSASDQVPELLTEEGINNVELLCYFFDVTASGAEGDQVIDCLRFHVIFAKYGPIVPLTPEIYVLEPNEVLELPSNSWEITTFDVGTWITTLTCDYRYAWTDETGYHTTAWIPSEKVKTLNWWILES